MEFAALLNRQTEDYHRARLLAVSSEHSGDWLHALPISSCGLRLDNEAIRVATGLRLRCTHVNRTLVRAASWWTHEAHMDSLVEKAPADSLATIISTT